MKSFVAREFGKMVIIHFGKGEALLEGIQREMERLNIKNAVVLSGIGSLRTLCMHVISTTADVSVNEAIVVHAPIELGALQGLILNGEPHLHLVGSAPGNQIYIGHLEAGCEVQYLAELVLLEIVDLKLIRKLDSFDVSYIDLHDEL